MMRGPTYSSLQRCGSLMKDDVEIGGSNLTPEAEAKLGELVDWVDANFETHTGSTAMYWALAHTLASLIHKEKQDENSN